LRDALLFTVPLLAVSALVTAVMYKSNPSDGLRAFEGGLAALMLGSGVTVVILLVFPWQRTWPGGKPGPMAGLAIASGLLGIGVIEAASITDIRIPGADVLTGMGTIVFIGGMYLYLKEAQRRGENSSRPE
jgi:hypothetical protein